MNFLAGVQKSQVHRGDLYGRVLTNTAVVGARTDTMIRTMFECSSAAQWVHQVLGTAEASTTSKPLRPRRWPGVEASAAVDEA